MVSQSPGDLGYLLSPQAIRERAKKIFDLSLKGETNYSIHLERFSAVTDLVVEVTRAKYPDLKIPFHSRWSHFKVGGWDRLAPVVESLKARPALERAQSLIDLVIVSVLLDAGAGPQWKFYDPKSGQSFGRSEGLAIASLFMFLKGDFSSDPEDPLRVDAEALERMSLEKLQNGFQVTDMNPMVGLQGRLNLLKRLGSTLRKQNRIFGGVAFRPGNLVSYLGDKFADRRLPAVEILKCVLTGLGPIWPGRVQLDETNLGDVWVHDLLGPEGTTQSLIPFHKLSQWLTYSLMEPLMDFGFNVVDVDHLTGLAEYRNGGLLIDSGLITAREPKLLKETHLVSSPFVVEWRALTIVFLDKLGESVRAALNKNAQEFPLAKVLEGGTWWAGRKLAFEKRPDGSSPLKIESDGTVF